MNIMELAIEAQRAGLDTPERVIARLEKLIARNVRYVDRRTGRATAFDDVVREDNQAIARAIVLLESMSGADDAPDDLPPDLRSLVGEIAQLGIMAYLTPGADKAALGAQYRRIKAQIEALIARAGGEESEVTHG